MQYILKHRFIIFSFYPCFFLNCNLSEVFGQVIVTFYSICLHFSSAKQKDKDRKIDVNELLRTCDFFHLYDPIMSPQKNCGLPAYGICLEI